MFGKNKAENAGTLTVKHKLPGDENGAWHSSDLWYWFKTLRNCWRPMEEKDYAVSEEMASYLCNFVKTGDPNGKNLPEWKPCTKKDKKVLCIGKGKTKMGNANIAINLSKGFSIASNTSDRSKMFMITNRKHISAHKATVNSFLKYNFTIVFSPFRFLRGTPDIIILWLTYFVKKNRCGIYNSASVVFIYRSFASTDL